MECNASMRRHIVGVSALLAVILLWIGSNFATKKILENFDKPFFVTFINCCSFQLYYIFLRVRDPLDAGNVEGAEKAGKLSKMQTAKLAFFFFPMYFFANYSNTAAFAFTSVGSATVITATSGLFTLLIGALFKTETITLFKSVAVVCSFSGVLVWSISKGELADGRFIGNLLALLGATLYGCYSTYLKRSVVDESRVSTTLLFAFSGSLVCLTFWPWFFALNHFEIETFVLPPNSRVAIAILVNMLFGSLIPNYLWNVAFLYTSPLAVALGLSCNIPITLTIDYVFSNEVFNWQKVLAAVLIVTGFLLANVASVPRGDRPKR